jgi:hypothetical protein
VKFTYWRLSVPWKLTRKTAVPSVLSPSLMLVTVKRVELLGQVSSPGVLVGVGVGVRDGVGVGVREGVGVGVRDGVAVGVLVGVGVGVGGGVAVLPQAFAGVSATSSIAAGASGPPDS